MRQQVKYTRVIKVGEEFDETTPDGRDVTAKVTLDGNKFVSEQKAKKAGQKSTKTIREFNGDEVVHTVCSWAQFV